METGWHCSVSLMAMMISSEGGSIPRLQNDVPKKSPRICSFRFAEHYIVHIRKDPQGQSQGPANETFTNADRVPKRLLVYTIPPHVSRLSMYFTQK